jgi:hypothetical protein
MVRIMQQIGTRVIYCGSDDTVCYCHPIKGRKGYRKLLRCGVGDVVNIEVKNVGVAVCEVLL